MKADEDKDILTPRPSYRLSIYYPSLCNDNLSTTTDTSFQQSKLPIVRKYELWTGNNIFCFYGIFMLGPQGLQFCFTFTLILLNWIGYICLIAPFIRNDLSYKIALSLLCCNLTTLCFTSFTEPGIIPKRVITNDKAIEVYLERYHVSLNYCTTCKILKPLRTRHCRYCNNCIQLYDHHCVWIGTCIGVRNYRFFLMFITSILLSDIFVLGSVCFLLMECMKKTPTNAFNLLVTGIIIYLPFSLLVGTFIGSLFLLHMLLLCRSQTTNEFFRGLHFKQALPWWIVRFNKLFMIVINMNQNVYTSQNDEKPLQVVSQMREVSDSQVLFLRESLHKSVLCECIYPRDTLLSPMYLKELNSYEDNVLQSTLIEDINMRIHSIIDDKKEID